MVALDVSDDGGDVVHVHLSGHNWRGEELVAVDLELPVGAEAE